MALAAGRVGPADAIARFTLSATAGERARSPITEFHRWWAERATIERFSVTRVPFRELDGWHLAGDSENLVHRSGRFFSVEGLRYRGDGPGEQSQPIINQPEIGILGILVKEFDGVLHCLMQAKMEPGNVNTLQLSPTVQATRSNYTRVHQGNMPPYLEYFRGPDRGQVLVDVLQSEQGVWFWRKRNRNMIVHLTEDVPEHEDFHWLPLDQIHQLLKTDNLVNMDARTVLACMPLARPSTADCSPDDPFAWALLNSYDEELGLHTRTEILSWFTESQTRCEWSVQRIPLSEVTGWSWSDDDLAGGDEAPFRIIGVRVNAHNREVTNWSQPLLEPLGHGLAVFLAKSIGGVVHFLVQARKEPGLINVVEMAPTVQLPAVAGAVCDQGAVAYAMEAAAADPRRVRFDALLSEEGGRFHHGQTRYQIIEVGEEFPVEVPDEYCWMTAHQLMGLLDHSHYLNIEARTLLACVHSLW
ncbi:oxidase EvaA [Nonomuraea polychroma]|uniref:Oxidase EvaA n=1 Tax=Nonomuraea polychroma TaxID=46176 RepID=A0A438LYX5_9ACTN|nr:NDP-hexose 2,3-dehydratase family protein [Nonomuraea polychroma]RVX38754.1 oxidase EvaA [Nonomuraea polychroma]